MKATVALLVVLCGLLWLTADSHALPVAPEVRYMQAACPHDFDDPATPEDENENVAGCAYDDGRAYVRKGMGPEVYWHEQGHQFDYQVLTDAHRTELQRLLEMPGEWSPEDTKVSPAERSASAYAICLMQANGRPRYGVTFWRRGRPAEIAGQYDYLVGYRRHRRICQVFWNAAGLRYDVPRAGRA